MQPYALTEPSHHILPSGLENGVQEIAFILARRFRYASALET
jgi:hypothetical protein